MVLDDLKELLRDGIITLPQYREEVAAVQSRVAAGSSGVGGAGSSSMRDVVEKSVESVSKVSVRTCELSEKRAEDVVEVETRDGVSEEEENTSGVGVGATKGKSVEVVKEGLDAPDVGASAMSGKSQYVQEEEVHVVASAEGMGGDIAYLLYDGSLEDYEKNGWGFRLPFLVSDVASCDAGASPALRPRLFDAAMQQITRLRPSVGAKRPRVRLRLGPSVGARPRVRLRPGQWNMLVARTALKEQAKAEAWRMEIQLVKMQIDAVTDDESVNLGCERSARWGSVTRW